MPAPGLIDAVSTTEVLTTYNRSYGGAFNNQYGKAPSLTFFMHRVTVKESDGSLVSESPLPLTVEDYSPGKVYQLYNPSTGAAIPGLTMTSEQVFAAIYSVMTQNRLEAMAAAEAAAAAAAAAENNGE